MERSDTEVSDGSGSRSRSGVEGTGGFRFLLVLYFIIVSSSLGFMSQILVILFDFIYQIFNFLVFGSIPGRWDAASSSALSMTSSGNPEVNLDPDMEEYSSDQSTSSQGSLTDELNPLRKAENELPLEPII